MKKFILITGSGRAGTTLLVQLLTNLGLDTGYLYQMGSTSAGMEHCVGNDGVFGFPYIIKDPGGSMILKAQLINKKYKVDHLIIPIRDMDQVARSRLDTGHKYPDYVRNFTDQLKVCYEMLGRSVEAGILFNIPMTLIHFPRMILDENYLYHELSAIFKLNKKEFKKEFKRLVKPNLMHKYEARTTKLVRA